MSIKLYDEHLKKYGSSIQVLSNMGICYYKLGQWKNANRLFKQAIEINPIHWEILYSLAVTEKKLGHTDQAIDLFILVFDQSDELSLSRAAYQQITALTESEYVSPAHNNVTGGLRIQYGFGEDSSYTDMIDSTTNTNEQQVNASAEINWLSHQNISDTWHLNAFIYHYQTVESDSLSYNILSVGAGKYHPFGRLKLYLGASIDYSLLDTEDYLVNASITGSIDFPVNADQALTTSYAYSHTEPLDTIFETEQALSHKLTIGYTLKSFNPFNWTINYVVEDEKTHDDYFEEQLSSLSSLEQSLDLTGLYTRSDWTIIGRINYSYRHFDEDDLFSDGTEIRRIDHTWLYSSQLLWQISRHINISVSYHYTDFDSTLTYQKRGHHQLGTILSSAF